MDQPTPRRDRTANAYPRGLVALALNHAANDMYMGFLPALLPLIVQRLDLSLTRAGLLVSIVSLTSQVTQPVFGYLSDRVGRRDLVIAGPLVTALSMAWLGRLGSYNLLAIAVICGGIGTAAFHPQGAALVGRIAGRRAGAAMAVFTAGGNLGYGIGPVLVIAVTDRFGVENSWLTLPLGLAATGFLIAALPRSVGTHRPAPHAAGGPDGRPWLAPLVVLFSVVMLRAVAVTLFTTFAPLLIARRGEALMLGGWTLLGFLLAGGVGGIVGGPLSDRYGRRSVTVVGMLLAGPALFFFLHSGGVLAAAMLLATGFCVFSALPVNIVMAQELLPGRASTASGIVMGLAWGIGGLSTTGLGVIADRLSATMGPLAGLARAMDIIALVPLAAALLALALPETRPRPGDAGVR